VLKSTVFVKSCMVAHECHRIFIANRDFKTLKYAFSFVPYQNAKFMEILVSVSPFSGNELVSHNVSCVLK